MVLLKSLMLMKEGVGFSGSFPILKLILFSAVSVHPAMYDLAPIVLTPFWVPIVFLGNCYVALHFKSAGVSR